MEQSDQRRQSSSNQSQQQQQQQHPLTGPPPPMAATSPTSYPGGTAPSYHQAQQFYSQQQQQQLQSFWAGQMQEVEATADFKNHSLPLARIKKIMKADEDVRMISAEAPVVFAKACEMFILELTLRSWIHTEENKRRTLQKNDIAAAISRTDVFDFLVDIVPRDELKEEGLGITKSGLGPFLGPPGDGVAAAAAMNPYYYMAPPPPQVGVSGVVMGNPVEQGGVYGGGGEQNPVGYMPWQQPPPPPQHGDS